VEIVVNARHTDVSSSLRGVALEKVTHLERFASDVRLVEVEFSDIASRRNADAHTCEILVHLRRRLVKGVASAAEQAVALDAAIEKVTHQMRRLHERRLVGRHGGPHRTTRGNGFAPDDLDLDVDRVLGEAGPDAAGAPAPDGRDLEIVRTKRFSSKPMDAEEAALQMALLGHDFFLFTNSENGRAAVVYRRRDGRLGLIEATG
jgi:ribosome hibernation promoting factor